MSVSEFARSAALMWATAGILVTAGCASSAGKQTAAAAPESPVTVTGVPGTGERDGRGSYRFLMQQGDKKMSADQFDAWMKANGIRVAKGKVEDRPAVMPVIARKEPAKDRKKKKK